MRNDKVIEYLDVAKLFAETFSKDQSTKVGAFILDVNGSTLLSRGYNGIPRGCNDDDPARHERPLKYSFFEHAERNAIYNLARAQLKGSFAVTTSQPSMSCTRALISVGVTEVFIPENEHKELSTDLSLLLFNEAKVQVWRYSKDGILFEVEDERKARKVKQFIAFAAGMAARLSKDTTPSATLFISSEDYTVLSEGYSGQPRGSKDFVKERYIGESRGTWVESSVRNAVYNSVRPLLKNSVAIVTATTCVECARALASVGTSKIYYQKPSKEFEGRWGTSIAEALTLLDELGVQHFAIDS